LEEAELLVIDLVYPSHISHWLFLSFCFEAFRWEYIISELLILITIFGKRAKVGLAAASLEVLELLTTDLIEL
jgi:hypothetical protein